ncbi:MAG: citryl-CoA lyase [Betaproteobacteria bacterium CG2_30_59_46]|nr:MAG: citryl-CoA lyase [Betaproteobacteria bacterium CG2_30_59_46]PIQ12890.1 MAG: citryl-CoA lyase [Hydrogenophilales bacterium CG18_big_fil_WC_8_21_14_2_50_58_12]PIY02007.1 MAG: citryl-CoA lyase [Hydrogenophilales bacterium CG_4_10_14_3_um_filter_58_23]PJB06637.1 MAG: citryl-CoA lyase [Hydrogenophilales bacterium CG_4_9_14_3_um_filter_59_35]
MKGPQLLEEHVGRLATRMGAFFPGERAVFRGHDLHASLKDLDWLELYLFGITGRRFTPQQMKVLHAVCNFTSYPDTRIWNNRVAALAGTARSTGSLGIAAALAVSEAQIYGWGVTLRAIEFLTRARAHVDAGEDLAELVRAELKRQRGIAGYGRPITSADERIAPMMALVREIGLDGGPHLRLAFEVERILLAGRWRLHMNYAALSAALCADFGMSPREYYFSSLPSFLSGMPPCYLDAVEKPAGLLFPLPCRVMLYEGVTRRQWQR